MIIEKIYLEQGNENVYVDAYISDSISGLVRDAILVIPGGGYGNVCSDREGEPIAQAFIPYGFNAFVLHYSVTSVEKRAFPTQLIQASLAIKLIKDNAEKFNIDPDRVFVTGFSAGGHLCASIGTLWHKKEIYEAVQMPYGYNKPTGIMPVYPVISGVEDYASNGSFENLFVGKTPTREELYEVSLEKQVDERSAPAFIVHTAADALVNVKNSLAFATAYADNNIPFELHIYPEGPHGMALANEITKTNNDAFIDDAFAKWVEQAVRWTKRIK